MHRMYPNRAEANERNKKSSTICVYRAFNESLFRHARSLKAPQHKLLSQIGVTVFLRSTFSKRYFKKEGTGHILYVYFSNTEKCHTAQLQSTFCLFFGYISLRGSI